MARPLNKCYPDGRQYTRLAEIENAIDNLLSQSLETQIRRAAVQDIGSPEYIATECLVHLIREARRRDDEATMNALLPPLLHRCEGILLSKVSRDLPNAEDIIDEILGQFSELFATDGTSTALNELDYFEVRFNSAFRTFRIDILRKENEDSEFAGGPAFPCQTKKMVNRLQTMSFLPDCRGNSTRRPHKKAR